MNIANFYRSKNKYGGCFCKAENLGRKLVNID
jgi:hypothetical protein